MKNVLVHMQVHPEGLDRLRSLEGVTAVDVVETEEEPVREFPAEQIRHVHVYFGTFLPSNHEAMLDLELVQITSAGYSQLAGIGLVERGVRACNGWGVFDAPIAEWNIAMMVNLARDLRGMVRDQDAGNWNPRARYQNEIRGKVVGMWGYGGIARQTARLCKAMGMEVHALTRNGVKVRRSVYCPSGVGDPEGNLPDRVFVADQRDEFLSGLDFLILAMPLNEHTEGIVGEHELRTLPDGAFLLNPARGPLVQEAALLRALREGWIAGAALDTHYHYPMPRDHPLWGIPNVFMTPHVSGSALCPSFNRRIWDIFLQNVERYLSGRPQLNELSAAQLRGE